MTPEHCLACGEHPKDIPAVMRRYRERMDALIAEDETPAGVECGAVSQTTGD